MARPTTSGRHSHRRHTRSAVLFAVLTVLIAGLLAPAAVAQPPDEPPPEAEEGLVRIDDVAGGALLFFTDSPGWYVPAPMLDTDIDVSVSGPIARVEVTQTFRNVADVFVEGRYVFPLPEGSSVDTLRMRVGDRWIEGRIEEKEEARLIYETAREAGQVASLVEQIRPNVFTTSVANIAPDADVVVQIEYQELLAPRDGVFGLRVPLVVAPRYTPAHQLQPRFELTSDGWQVQPSDAADVNPPVVDPRTEDPDAVRNPVRISVDLDAGFPLGAVDSTHHEVTRIDRGETAALIDVTGRVPADRDFLLSWAPTPLDEPYAAVFTETFDGETHHVAVLTPPAAEAIETDGRPREVIFVQDTSGSMSGDSIRQAKASLIAALNRLDDDDTFTVYEFNSVWTVFEREPVAATSANVDRAVAWVRALEATGGTEMLPALGAALTDRNADDDRLRQVIFLTDGAVSNELEMLDLIDGRLGRSRLFTVGIGSAPNSYFMTAAARAGRGSFIYVSDLAEVDAAMAALFRRIETPAVVDLIASATGADISPSPVPDLYAGDPIVLTVRALDGAAPDVLTMVGRRGDTDWSIDVALDAAEDRPGVSRLWAREKIRDLEALRVSPLVNQIEREEIDAEILAIALDFGIVSRLTSLVAVDLEITRPEGEPVDAADVAANLPDGWDPDAFFAVQDSFDPRADDELGVAVGQRLEAAQLRRAQSEPGLPFAATGADWQLQAGLGLALLTLGALLVRRRPQRTS